MRRAEWIVKALMWNAATPVGASSSRGHFCMVELSRNAFFKNSIRNDLSVPAVPWIIMCSVFLAMLLRKCEKMILNAMVWLGDKEERECAHGFRSWWDLVKEQVESMKQIVVSCKCGGIVEWPQLCFVSNSRWPSISSSLRRRLLHGWS